MRTNMNVVALWCGLVILAFGAPAAAQAPSGTGAANARQVEAYGRLPLTFEPNQGQTSREVKFLARGPGYRLFLTNTEMVLALREPRTGSAKEVGVGKGSVVRMKLVGANAKAEVSGEKDLPGKSNYFMGRDPAKWRRNVPQFAGVRYRGVYPGVDLIYRGNQRQLEYDFVIAPGTNPRVIRARFSGISGMKLNSSGDLVLAAGGSEVTLRAPLVYQEIEGTRQAVAGHFVVHRGRELSFDIGRYDTSRALIIDPTVVYSTYLGGSNWEEASAAVDQAGNVYLAGITDSPNFPMTGRLNDKTPFPYREIAPTQGWVLSSLFQQAFVAKLNSDGRSLAYSTFVDLGGGGFHDIAVDLEGRAYVVGNTFNADVPLVNAAQPTCPSADIYTRHFDCSSSYILKLSSDGVSVVYSTFMGTVTTFFASPISSISVDSNFNTYLAGWTSDPSFPTVNALQSVLRGSDDAVVVKLNADGGCVYSTYLGGSSSDTASGVAADAGGNAYVVGSTNSTDFPTVNPVQPSHAPNDGSWRADQDGFVAKLAPDGLSLLYSTYLGGSRYDSAESVVVNAAGTAWVAGASLSSDFPTTLGRPSPGRGFLVKLDDGGQFVYSTGVHVSSVASFSVAQLKPAKNLAVDSAENVYIASSAHWSGYDWPLVNPLRSATYLTAVNVVIEKLDPAATTILFSTFWGGTGRCTLPVEWGQVECGPNSSDWLSFLGLDGAGNIYAVGYTTNDDFPTVNAFQPTPGGVSHYDCQTPGECLFSLENHDIFLVKIAQQDNTSAGQQVSVVPADGASITFEAVTSPGTTSFTSLAGAFGWWPPTDLRLGDPPVYYEISTTASYTGGVTVCLDYSNITFSVKWGLRLYHYENGEWIDITTSVENNIICGIASSLSPFAIFGTPLPPVDVVGLAPPLAPLVPEGSPIAWPDKAFKLGRTLPLRLQLLIQGVPLTDQQVKAPMIAQVRRVGESPLNLDTMDLDAGEANDNTLMFRFSDGSWGYNLGTQGLSPGSYIVTIQLWDGRRFEGGFVLKN